MSTKVFAFAVPSDVRDARVLSGITSYLVGAPSCIERFRNVYANVERPSASRVRYVHLTASRPPDWEDGGIAADPFLGSFMRFTDVPVTALWHDDQNGVFLFECWHTSSDEFRTLSILSDGPYVASCVGTITADFVQAAYSHEELRALNARDFAGLSPQELRVVEEWENAITIGLRQTCPGDTKRYLGEAAQNSIPYQVVRDHKVLSPLPLKELRRDEARVPLVMWHLPDDVFGYYDRWVESGLPSRSY